MLIEDQNKNIQLCEELAMYLDDVVIAGVAIVVVTTIITLYIGRFMYRHVKEDIKKSSK